MDQKAALREGLLSASAWLRDSQICEAASRQRIDILDENANVIYSLSMDTVEHKLPTSAQQTLVVSA